MSKLTELQEKMYADGLLVQDYFKLLAERDGYICDTATKYQDKYEHWDISMKTKNSKKALVDVKGNKEVHKLDLTWLELQTVDKRNGWMCGKAHYIAFERDNRFDLYHREKMLKFLLKKILNPTGLLFKKSENLFDMIYHRYMREGRLDIMVLTPFIDIEEFIIKTIYK